MATPQGLQEVALGFSLTEGIVQSPRELLHMAERPGWAGIEMALTIPDAHFADLRARRNSLAGRTGYGPCGVDSLVAAVRPLRVVHNDVAVSPAAIVRALDELLRRQAPAIHAAAGAGRDGAIFDVRE